MMSVLQEKEASYNAPIPRILSIDTYFINEVEKVEKDPATGTYSIQVDVCIYVCTYIYTSVYNGVNLCNCTMILSWFLYL